MRQYNRNELIREGYLVNDNYTIFYLLNSAKRYDSSDRPAFIEFSDTGTVMMICWYKDGQLHREDGPAKESIAYVHTFKPKENVRIGEYSISTPYPTDDYSKSQDMEIVLERTNKKEWFINGKLLSKKEIEILKERKRTIKSFEELGIEDLL